MKFPVANKELGEFLKKEIMSEINSDRHFISLAEVKEMFREIPDKKEWNEGWDAHIRNKCRVRETKAGWFVYLPEPNVHITKNEDASEIFERIFENFAQTNNQVEREIEAINGITRGLGKLTVEIYTRLDDLVCMVGGKTGYLFRPCIVKAKKSGLKEERQDREAKFHRWVDLSKGVRQVVALVEFEDGHVEQVQPDRIVFGEWQEEEE